jgi:ATPase subunit of ABC transporter with duplicated ATPase domains
VLYNASRGADAASRTMLTVSEVTKSYGGRVLFEDVTATFERGVRYGLTGANGAGKSTFMKILAGDLEPDRGIVTYPNNARMSVLHQDHFRYQQDRVRDVVIMGNRRLWAAMEEKERLLSEGDTSDEVGMRLGELEVVIAEENGYDAEAEADRLLDGLGIHGADHEQPLGALDPGLRVRVLLAQALFGTPDILLLDEPTNDLDLDSIHWLEDFLEGYGGVLVVISHDRHFLNSVCTHTADVDYENIIVYPGAYDEMLMQKVQYRTQVEKTNEAKKKRILELQDFIRRFGANAKKASQAQSRRRQMEKIQIADLKRSNIQRPFFRFDLKNPSGKLVIEAKGLAKQFDGRDVLRDVTFTLTRGEKMAIVGPNGIGKTTLCRCIAGVHKPDRGILTLGHEVLPGYLPQHHEEGMGGDRDKNAYEWLHQWDDKAGIQEVRGLLGRMLFPSEEAEKPVRVLSGGETVRLLMSKLTLLRPNLLILDEPTNHLDLEAIRALIEALQAYEGTLVFVCHDHYMVSEVATCVLSLEGERGADFFPGRYEEFLEKTGRSVAR